jgi:hypothetical protein
LEEYKDLKITLAFRYGYKIMFKGDTPIGMEKESEKKDKTIKVPKSTAYMGDFECPECGLYGKLKMDVRGKTSLYSIEHFNRSGRGWSDHNSAYKGVHYIGDKFKLGTPW